MPTQKLLKNLLVAFLLALVAYAGLFHLIEHRRTRNGPWEISFDASPEGAPRLSIQQSSLGITNVQITFAGRTMPTNTTARVLTFPEPKPVPFDVPFGRCVFLDTTTLPGTVALSLFGHEIQLLPRTLTVDGEERSWRAGETVTLSRTNRASTAAGR